MSCVTRLSYLQEASTSTVGYTILGSTNVLLAIFITFGNCLIMHALRKSQSLHAPTKALICSLALSDLGVGLVVNPLFATYCVAVVYNKSELFCNIQGPYAVAGYGLGSVSFLTMTVIALDRFYAVKLTLRYRQVITFKRVVLALVACWTFGFVWPFGWLLSEKITMITVMIVILCCVVMTSISCTATSCRIRQHHQQLQQAQRTTQASHQHGGNQLFVAKYKKSLNTMILMFCILLTCYLPYFCVVAITMVTTSNSGTTALAFNITSEIIYLNSLLNPMVYFWRIREVRREVLNVLRRFAC